MANEQTPNPNRRTLLKSIGLLLLVILLFSIFARKLLSGGQTLAEYAQEHPELAYGSVSYGDVSGGDLPE